VPDRVDPARGPLNGIERNAANEIGKIWSLLEDRLGYNPARVGDRTLVTRADLTRTETALGKRIDSLTTPVTQAASSVGGGVSSGSILGTDNRFTGRNTFDHVPQPGNPSVRVQALSSGPLVPVGGGATILLEDTYNALVDLRRTSSANADASPGGGNAALYVQHRIDSTTANANNVNCGIRVQVESWQRSVAPVNDVVGGYFGLYNHGFNSGGFGVHVDAYHAATFVQGGPAGVGPVTYGMSVELFREFLDGKTIGFHARSIDDGATYRARNDYGVLLSGPGKFDRGFALGSNYIGPVTCTVGLDLGYATCSAAAISVKGGDRVQLNGPATNVGLYFDPRGWVQFFSDVGNTVRIGNDGTFNARGATLGATTIAGLQITGSAQFQGRDLVTGVGAGGAPVGPAIGTATISWGGSTFRVGTY
jgi:hypothetical protein